MRYKTRLFDLAVVVLLVLLSSTLTIFLELNFLFTTILFFGLPSGYLIYKKPNNIKKTTLFAIIFGMIWSFSFDYIAELNNAWNWAINTDLIIQLKFFNVVSPEIMVWYFLWTFSIIAFYEYFIEYDNSRKISKNALPIALSGIVVAFVVVILSKTTGLLIFNYTYLWLGCLSLIPYIYVVTKNPKVFTKSLVVMPYFMFLFFIFELTALYTDLWSFPGNYIGVVSFGDLVFPFEELFFWVIASSAVAVAYYEHSVDDTR